MLVDQDNLRFVRGEAGARPHCASNIARPGASGRMSDVHNWASGDRPLVVTAECMEKRNVWLVAGTFRERVCTSVRS